jgi:hypothetical protein
VDAGDIDALQVTFGRLDFKKAIDANRCLAVLADLVALREEMVQPSAKDVRKTCFTASLLNTGSAPGRPRHTGQQRVFGSPPKAFSHPQNILL